jgi:hypothetical protein
VTRVSNWQFPTFVLAIGIAGCVYSALQIQQCDSRHTADFLASKASENDTVVFTSLSRPPIDHYLQGVPHAAFLETTFPTEIDAHPGYEGALLAPGRAVRLRQEADELVARLRRRSGRIYFLRGFHPEIDGILEWALDGRFQREETKQFDCGGMPCYYDAISVYR